MADFERLRRALERHGYTVSHFQTAEEAADNLDRRIDGKTVGMGGSLTLEELDLARRLAAHNVVLSVGAGDDRRAMADAQVYLCSVNAVAESGELVNIDGTGNRIASTLFGHEALYLVISANKVVPTLEQAIWRARNIAAPRNAKRLGRNTPCVAAGHCCDCSSPDRICHALSVLWQRPGGIPYGEVVFIEDSLGL